MNVVSRRLELLKLEGFGFSQAEVVKELGVKRACSKWTVYSDFETRESWQPTVQSAMDAHCVLLKVVNRYEQVYRQASFRTQAYFRYTSTHSDTGKPLWNTTEQETSYTS